MSLLLVWSSFPNEPVAVSIAKTLVSERLAACVHVAPKGRSYYLWKSCLHAEEEWLLMIKTPARLYDHLEKRLCALHPYDTPEILAVSTCRELPAYLSWACSVTMDESESESESGTEA